MNTGRELGYPRIVRIESEPGKYSDSIVFYLEWRYWGVRLNGVDGVGGVLGVCRADGRQGREIRKDLHMVEGEDLEAEDWRARFEVSVYTPYARSELERLGMPEGGTIVLETDDVVAPERN